MAINYRNILLEIIEPLFKVYNEPIVPANPDQIQQFTENAKKNEVPNKVISELTQFYEITNGIPCLDSLTIHKADDEILYEWWENQELWIGQRDFYTIRYHDGKFHLGGASDLNFGEEYIFDSLIDLLKSSFKYWYPEGVEN